MGDGDGEGAFEFREAGDDEVAGVFLNFAVGFAVEEVAGVGVGGGEGGRFGAEEVGAG